MSTARRGRVRPATSAGWGLGAHERYAVADVTGPARVAPDGRPG